MFLKYSLLLFYIIAVNYSYCQVCKTIEDSHRLDCAPDKPNDEEVCIQRKCCYVKHNSTNGMISKQILS